MKRFFQKHWSLLVMFVTGMIAFLFFRKNIDLNSRIHSLNERHREEINKIEAARALERKQKEENEKKYKDTLELIKRKYIEEKQELDRKKEKEILEMVTKHGSDPQELALILSEVTGFKIILPED